MKNMIENLKFRGSISSMYHLPVVMATQNLSHDPFFRSLSGGDFFRMIRSKLISQSAFFVEYSLRLRRSLLMENHKNKQTTFVFSFVKVWTFVLFAFWRKFRQINCKITHKMLILYNSSSNIIKFSRNIVSTFSMSPSLCVFVFCVVRMVSRLQLVVLSNLHIRNMIRGNKEIAFTLYLLWERYDTCSNEANSFEWSGWWSVS